MNDDALGRALAQACEGLLYPSETDAPVRAIAWTGDEPPTCAAVLYLLGRPSDTEVVTTTAREEFGPIAEGDARFEHLLELLESNLDDTTVFRVGRIDVTLLVLGRAKGGAWLGVETRAVET